MYSTKTIQFSNVKTKLSSLEPGIDKANLRLSLVNLLNSADLYPSGLPPSAILIVKHMADPLPGSIALLQSEMRIKTSWEQAFRNSLTDLYRCAARPIQGYAPLNAEAVCFSDWGEMLASLALDLSLGKARRQWWWKAILQSLPSITSEALTMILRQKAVYVPASLHLLSRWNQAVTVINTLSPAQAMTVLSVMGCSLFWTTAQIMLIF